MRAYADEDEAATLTAAAAVNDWGRYLKHAAENAAEREGRHGSASRRSYIQYN